MITQFNRLARASAPGESGALLLRVLLAGMIAGPLAVQIEATRRPEDEGGDDAATTASWALDIADEIIKHAGAGA